MPAPHLKRPSCSLPSLTPPPTRAPHSSYVSVDRARFIAGSGVAAPRDLKPGDDVLAPMPGAPSCRTIAANSATSTTATTPLDGARPQSAPWLTSPMICPRRRPPRPFASVARVPQETAPTPTLSSTPPPSKP